MKSTLRLIFCLSSMAFASVASAVPLDNAYFVGVDGLATLSSGTYSGLPNPNEGRLTFLFAHGDHYHGIGAYSYSGPASAPTVTSTNTNNTIPELFTGLPPLSLVEGSGIWAGRYVSGLGSRPQDVEYGNLNMLATAALAATGDPVDTVLFNSSGGRWTGPLGAQQIGLELVSLSAGLEVADSMGNLLFSGGAGSAELIGVGDALDFDPVFFTTLAGDASYSASFRLLDLGTVAGGGTAFGDSGTFTLAFAVPEPGSAVLLALGLFGLASVRRARCV